MEVDQLQSNKLLVLVLVAGLPLGLPAMLRKTPQQWNSLHVLFEKNFTFR